MKKFSLITAESTVVKQNMSEYPCVVLFGRDNKGEKHKYRTKFYPYCYIQEKDYTRLVEEGFNFNEFIREAIGTSKRTITKRALTKLYFKNKDAVKGFTKVMGKHLKEGEKDHIFTYEADMGSSSLLALRYLINMGITSGFCIEDDTVIPVDVECKLRKWYIDFEAYSTKMCGHGPKKNEPIIMVTIYDNYEDKLYTLYTFNECWIYNDNLKENVLFSEINLKHKIIGFDTEAKLLDYLVDLVIKLDPDMFIAWNLDRYDIVQWKYRQDANAKDCIYNFKSISPLKSINFNSRPYRIKGRILFDLMRAFKKFTQSELRSYSLGAIAEYEKLGIDKIPFKGTTANTWDNYPGIIFKRNVNDVLILKALDEKYELVEMFNDLRTEYGALFHEALINYRILDTALLRFVNRKYVLKTASKGKSGPKFLGAVVVKPIVGAHEWVLQFDFHREYPNIMKLFNISPETYRNSDYTGECYTIEYNSPTKEKLIFKFIKKPIGLLPQLINYFFKKRDDYEVEYKKAIGQNNKSKIKMWWRRIFNVKGITNAIYGVMDFPSFRLHKKECSEAVAIIGRISIEKLQEIVTKLLHKFIYGDTDSIFVKVDCQTKEEALEIGKELAEQLNSGLEEFFTKEYGVTKAPSVLALQKIYSRYLLIGRKNYAGKYVYDEKKGFTVDEDSGWDFKGFEVIRSDSSDLEKNVLEELVKKFLNGEPIDKLNEYIEGVYREFWNKNIEPIKLAYPLQISKSWINYLQLDKNGRDKTPSHVRAALYSNAFLNTDFEYEDKPRRLPIKADFKKNKFQSTLFKEESYPGVWKYKDREWKLKDISIAEDMYVPEYFINRIDWDRIHKRLKGKIEKIMKLIGEAK